jgi:hypothetical protein
MSGPNESERPAPAASDDAAGVLARLPRTRPQRSSPRRAAARTNASRGAGTAGDADRRAGASSGQREDAAAQQPPASSNGHASARGKSAVASATKRTPRARSTGASRPRRSAARKTAARKTAQAPSAPAPRQGFECESENAGRTVHPPGGAEIAASVAEIFGDLAKAGVSAGERLLKDALSRLPL